MGKGGQKKSAAPASGGDILKKELLIEGRYYDVTNMKHPGGSVINYYAGEGADATQAYNEFHIRSKRAKKFLSALPSRPADKKELPQLKGQQALLEDFNKFHLQLMKEGLYGPSYTHTFLRIAEIILMHAAGFWLLFNGYTVAAVIILGVVSGRCGWLMHEGGHYSMTGNISIDLWLQILLFGLGDGMSASWWRIQHNKHHSTPQKVGFDVDLNTLPLVAFTRKIVKKAGFPQKLWIRLQPVLFPLITNLLVAVGWQFYLHPRHALRTRNYRELATMLTRYALWHTFITSHFGLWNSTGLYLAYSWVGSNYIFLNFAVSHTHLPTVDSNDTSVDWVRYAAIHTMNVSPGPLYFITWWMSYLNFQIEHHLFPCMPQFRHPIISPRVKALFEKHGLKYDQRSYTQAMKDTFSNLGEVGAEVFLG